MIRLSAQKKHTAKNWGPVERANFLRIFVHAKVVLKSKLYGTDVM